MILPDVALTSRVNQSWKYSGIDSPTDCLDKTHFKQYPHAISYQYNSRGFRDQEWPDTLEELKTAIWCVGDSFTVGVGSPVEHTWPSMLQKQTGQRIINVSMDGASNNWISRQVKQIQHNIAPKNIVIMWSYLHRRECNYSFKSDEDRRLHSSRFPDESEDLLNFKHCTESVDLTSDTVLQFSVPDYTAISFENLDLTWKTLRGHTWPAVAPKTSQELSALPAFIQSELKQNFKIWDFFQEQLELNCLLSTLTNNIVNVTRLDLARDGHHFDVLTAQWVVDQIVDQLDSPI
jgi:hypothetical protein